MFASQSVVRLENPQGAMVINLPLFPVGSNTALNYIPDKTPGIYSWFRSFRYPDCPDEFYSKLIEDIERPKFIERTGNISPYYQIGIRSFGKLSDGKRLRLKKALDETEFREELQKSLDNSLMFQAPLYVGKASNLRKRIATHLTPDSILRHRLQAVGIDLDKSTLLICPIRNRSNNEDIDSDLDSSEDDSDAEIEFNDELANVDAITNEDLFEEIFSRLFSPQFSIKLG